LLIVNDITKDQERFIDVKTGFRNTSAFFDDLDWEIKRLNRYGHRFSVLLIEIIGNDKVKKKFPELAKKILRATDLLYALDDGKFAAILPCTHETGGECAALRLKRETKRALYIYDAKLDINIGVISIDTHTSKTPDEIYELVKKDLFKDRL